MSDDYDALEAAERCEMAMDEMNNDELARLRHIERAAREYLTALDAYENGKGATEVSNNDLFDLVTQAINQRDALRTALQPLRAGEKSSG